MAGAICDSPSFFRMSNILVSYVSCFTQLFIHRQTPGWLPPFGDCGQCCWAVGAQMSPEDPFSGLLGLCPEVGSLGHLVILCEAFRGPVRLSSTEAAPVHVPTRGPRCRFPPSLPTLVTFCSSLFFLAALPVGVRRDLIVAWTYSSTWPSGSCNSSRSTCRSSAPW